MTFNEKIFLEVLVEKTNHCLGEIHRLVESRDFASDAFANYTNLLTVHLMCLGMTSKAQEDGVVASATSEVGFDKSQESSKIDKEKSLHALIEKTSDYLSYAGGLVETRQLPSDEFNHVVSYLVDCLDRLTRLIGGTKGGYNG